MIPTVEEKYILQKSLIAYVWNNLRKKNFIPLSEILETKTLLAAKARLAARAARDTVIRKGALE